MNGLPYYKAYPRDFFEGTIGMGFELKGAYRLLLDLIYQHGGRLSDDSRFIAGQIGCSVKRWNLFRDDLIKIGKIFVSGESLTNLRADKELEILRRFQDKQRENASQPRENKGLEQAMAEPKLSHTEPEPYREKKEERREAKASRVKPSSANVFSILSSVASPDMAHRFIKLRADMRKPITDDMADAMASKLKGHPDPDAVLENSIANGWQGIFPDKIKPTVQQNGRPSASGQGRLSAFIAGASSAPRMDSWSDSNPSQPLLARR